MPVSKVIDLQKHRETKRLIAQLLDQWSQVQEEAAQRNRVWFAEQHQQHVYEENYHE